MAQANSMGSGWHSTHVALWLVQLRATGGDNLAGVQRAQWDMQNGGKQSSIWLVQLRATGGDNLARVQRAQWDVYPRRKRQETHLEKYTLRDPIAKEDKAEP